ncbi:hypothetical protein [Hyphomicrobium sp. D-2]|uniref:hypothetical protein n=1 Tax=Hyphomicrobium sp. D-2 TaxID=3041621 RepID=UPI00245605F9|nr:hypothetical protein [Hyphomicrobium sp. D-2]MDH4982157.1 hypothetical protein [Hyphomicrobium sp. D-2]
MPPWQTMVYVEDEFAGSLKLSKRAILDISFAVAQDAVDTLALKLNAIKIAHNGPQALILGGVKQPIESVSHICRIESKWLAHLLLWRVQ